MPTDFTPQPQPAARALSCPNCGGTVSLRAAGYTVTLVCIHCSSLLDVSRPDVRLIVQFDQAVRELEIPLGTRGTLRGVEWEAIGYLRRSEGGQYPWEEYLLFNPYHGYRWLITNGRGWSFGEMLTRAPIWSDGAVSLDGEPYQPFFADGLAQVDYVLGEFYWRVRHNDKVRTDDYVRPGWMLSREADGKEISWTLSAWLPPEEIEQAFGVKAPRNPWPPLPHQPSPFRARSVLVSKIALGAILFLFLLTLLFSGSSTLLRHQIPVSLDGKSGSVTLGPFTVNRPYQIVRVDARAPGLEQGWIDLEYSLVDRATQASFQAYDAAERYSGRDSDGAWTEGSRGATVKLAAIPPGTYDLVVDYQGNRWTSGRTNASPEMDLRLEVSQARIFPSNFIIAAILILFPVIAFWNRHFKFEHARKSESDFAPDDSDDEED